MRRNHRNLALMAITASAILPSTASAQAGATCGKNYSKNSVNGDYCVSPTSSSKPVTAAAGSTPAQVIVKHDGFSWGDAGVGASGALVLIIATGGSAVLIRRRQGSATVGGLRSPANR
jgi:hypothetical protein